MWCRANREVGSCLTSRLNKETIYYARHCTVKTLYYSHLNLKFTWLFNFRIRRLGEKTTFQLTCFSNSPNLAWWHARIGWGLNLCLLHTRLIEERILIKMIFPSDCLFCWPHFSQHGSSAVGVYNVPGSMFSSFPDKTLCGQGCP